MTPAPRKSTPPSPDLLQQPAARAALAWMFGGFQCAEFLRRSRWEFACDLARLRGLGVTDQLLEALFASGYVEQEPEGVAPSANGHLTQSGSTGWSSRSCFALTHLGAGAARVLSSRGGDVGLDGAREQRGRAVRGRGVPEWRSAVRELRYRGKVVKRFHRAAPNQEGVLAAFAELGWPGRIDDPLPKEPGGDSAGRLRETVKSLNRQQTHALLVFRVEPDGRGIEWASR